jgi:GxxExxY protein
MPEMLHAEVTEKVIGICMKVHRELGNGFQEVMYQRAAQIELTKAGIEFDREYPMPVYYGTQHIGNRRVDFLIEKKISVEFKAVINLEAVHIAQAKNYLEAYNLQVGLLINFGSVSLQIRRLLNLKYIDKNLTNPEIK